MAFQTFVKGLCFSIILSIGCYASDIPETYTVNVGKFSKHYSIVEAPGNSNTRIVYIPDFVDNNTLNKECASTLAMRIKEELLNAKNHAHNFNEKDIVLLMAGDKANQFGTYLKEALEAKDLVILRSSNKGNDSVFQVDYSSITSPGSKILYLRADQKERIQNATVILIDDVLSSGGTMDAVKKIAEHVNAQIVGYAVMATEGEERQSFHDTPLLSLFHLPVYTNKKM